MLTVGIIVYGVDPHVPMLLGVMGAAIMAFILGYSREQIEGFMIKGISKVMQSIIILVIIGVLIGVWLDAGVIPGRMYSEEYKKMGLSPTSLSTCSGEFRYCFLSSDSLEYLRCFHFQHAWNQCYTVWTLGSVSLAYADCMLYHGVHGNYSRRL